MIARWLLASSLFLTLSLSGANYLPNSSFELGMGRGWWFQNGSTFPLGETMPPNAMLTNSAYYGGYSFRFPTVGYLRSRPVYLTAGTWTMSFYAKVASGTYSAFYWRLCPVPEMDHYPTQSGSVGTAWDRFTHTVTLTTNAFCVAYFMSLTDNTKFPQVDGVQIESGGSATAYAPLSEVEFALDTGATATNGIFLSADTKAFQIKTYNNGGATATNNVFTSVYDTFNNLLGTNYTVVTAGVGATTNTVSLPAHTGWMDIIGRSLAHDSLDELTVAVLPYAASLTVNTNLLMGNHPHNSTYYAAKYRRMGYGWFRPLSPAYDMLGWDHLEVTKGVWTFNDAAVTRVKNAGCEILGILNGGSGDGGWMTWATNLDGSPKIADFTNYAYTVAARYGSAGTGEIRYWEVLNEPQNFVGTFSNVVDYADLLTQTCQALRDADPNSRIVAMAGASDETWSASVWAALDAATKAKIGAVSCHLYSWNTADPNSTDYNSFWLDWKNTWSGIRPVWFTESGYWGGPGYKGLNGFTPYLYEIFSTFTYECDRGERLYRQQYEIERWMDAVIRALGNGFQQVDYYDARGFTTNPALTSSGANTVEEHNDSVRPHAVSTVILQNLIGAGVAGGRFTNTATVALEMYSWSTPMLAVWNNDRTLRTLTLTNSNVGVVDYMGNVIQTNSATIPVGRSVRYILSSTLNEGQLRQTFTNATVATATDTEAPKVAFYIAPTGNYTTGDPMTLCRWDSVDNRRVNYSGVTAERTNVVYKWKLDSGAYSAFSASNHVWLPTSMANGNHVLYVTAQDAGVNSAEYTYEFAPEPTAPLPPGVTKVIRAATGKVGQITTP